MACGRRCAVAGPTVQRIGFEIISHRLGIVCEPRRRGRPPREKMLCSENPARMSGDTKTDPPGDTKTDPLLDTC